LEKGGGSQSKGKKGADAHAWPFRNEVRKGTLDEKASSKLRARSVAKNRRASRRTLSRGKKMRECRRKKKKTR